MLCIFRIALLISSFLQSQSPWDSLVYPTHLSGVFQGRVAINGNPASGSDWIAAFDEDGNCAGADTVWIINDESIINFPIYGDDHTSPNIDEGINGGEAFILKLWLSSQDTILEFPDPFYCWFNNNGAPMIGCGDVTMEYNFELGGLAVVSNEYLDNVILYNNYPNPFNSGTTILFDVTNPTNVLLNIYNLKGKIVNQFTQNPLGSGQYSMKWNGKNNNGIILPSGIYFYQLFYTENGVNKSHFKKMEYIK